MQRQIRLVALVLSLAAATATTAETFTWPDTHAGRHGAAFVEAVNAGDEAAFTKYDAEHRAESARTEKPIAQLMPMMLQMQQMTGELVPHSIASSEALELVLFVKLSALDQFAQLTVRCEDEPPHKVTSVGLQPSADPTVEAATYDDWSTLPELLQQVRADGEFPALAAAVVVGGDIVSEAAVGVRVLGDDTQVTVDDRFHIGSITKSMTAAVLARVISKGSIGWNTTLAEVLPDIEMRPEYRTATLEQLMQHRAGIQPHLTYDDVEMQRRLALPGTPFEQRAAYVAEVLMEEPIAEPGTETNYSNAGYTIVAHIAERIRSAAGWEGLLEEVLFRPLHMDTAGIGWPARPRTPGHPRGHTPDGPQPLDDKYVLGAFMGPAGDVHCSAGDLARYGDMHVRALRGEYVREYPADIITRLHTSLEDEDKPQRYACGWVIRDDGVHWHNGSAGTFFSLLALYPADNMAVAVLMNCANGSSQALAWKVADALHDRAVETEQGP